MIALRIQFENLSLKSYRNISNGQLLKRLVFLKRGG